MAPRGIGPHSSSTGVSQGAAAGASSHGRSDLPRPTGHTGESASLSGRVSLNPPGSASAVPLPSVIETSIHGLTADAARALIEAGSSTARRGPHLVQPGDSATRAEIARVYKIDDTEETGAFRALVLDKLQSEWAATNPPSKVEALTDAFLQLAERIDTDGVGVLGDLLPKSDFFSFMEKYDTLMEAHGNKTWLHSYCDLRRHPEFLYDSDTNKGFFHPLLVSLVSYHMGGPVRLNDARAKDTTAQVVNTLDSMPHLDNVPFTKEVKITHFWETGKAKAPDGQCFVCFPGGNKTPRAPDGYLNADGEPVLGHPEEGEEPPVLWTTEAGSVFRTEEEIAHLFTSQAAVRGEETPQIVALRGQDRVLTAIAETGALPHHRWRVEGGTERSCLLLSFHKISDDPGRVVDRARLDALMESGDTHGSALTAFILGDFPDEPTSQADAFAATLDGDVASSCQTLLEGVFESDEYAKLYDPSELALDEEGIAAWKKSALCDPGATAKKDEAGIWRLGETLSHAEYVEKVKQSMMYDKAGVLELILYSDGREEKRKWARNQIRELRRASTEDVDTSDKPLTMDARFSDWAAVLAEPPSISHLRTKEELASLGRDMTEIAASLRDSGREPTEELRARIGKDDILPAITQLANDLSLAIEKASNPECFHSTGLFLFWTVDTLIRTLPECEEKTVLKGLGRIFLQHYAAMNLTLEKAKEHRVVPPEALVEPSD